VWDTESGANIGRETKFSPLLEIDIERRRRQQEQQNNYNS
jgi:hypothetical protein